MIIKNTSSPSSTSGDMASSKASIDPKNSDFIGSLLRDKIYTDKILAPIREFILNALDSHVESKSDKNVEVRIVKDDSGKYTWSCRDFGYGLSENDVREIFFMYGNSTKRNTNSQVGMLGLGAKSFYAYTDTYFVTSYHEGVKTSYCATLEASDQGQSVGVMYKVSEEPTTETGIEISADVTNDAINFHAKTLLFVNELTQYQKIIYIDHSGSEHVPRVPEIVFVKDGYIVNGYSHTHAFNNDGRIRIYGTSSIRMGGVIYSKINPILPTHIQSNFNIITDVPIGKLTVPPSRESLDDSKSNNKILSEIFNIIDEIFTNERKSFICPKVNNYIATGGFNYILDGAWGRCHMRDIFKDTYELCQNIEKIGSDILPNSGGKYPIYILPDNSAYKSWSNRLNEFLTLDPNYTGHSFTVRGKGQCVMELYTKNTETLDVSDCIFVDVKKMQLPRFQSSSKSNNTGPQRYSVYSRENDDKYTPIELFQNTKNTIYDDSEWFKSKSLTRKELNARCIGKLEEHGKHNYFLTTGSIKMYNELIYLGFIDPGSYEYRTAHSIICDREEIDRVFNKNNRLVKAVLFGIKSLPQVTASIIKNRNGLSKIQKVTESILLENSTRRRILESIDIHNHDMTRSDLRAIMRLK
jgi:Histidine kinase-, DNA gyrase B-, and HSP90-like ATPase